MKSLEISDKTLYVFKESKKKFNVAKYKLFKDNGISTGERSRKESYKVKSLSMKYSFTQMRLDIMKELCDEVGLSYTHCEKILTVGMK